MRYALVTIALAAIACSKSAPPPPTATGSAGSAGLPAPGQPGHGSALVGVMAGSDMPACVPDGIRLPKDFPSEFPVPAGARALSSQPWSAGTLVRFAAHGTDADTWAFFTKELPGKGFVVGKHDRTGAAPSLAWRHDSLQGIVAIGPLSGCADMLDVAIGYAPVEPAKK